MRRWSTNADGAVLQSVARGQEFVFDAAGNAALDAWVRRLVGRHGGR